MARLRSLIFDVFGIVAVVAMGVSFVFLVREHGTGFGELELEISQEDLESGFREGYEYHAIYSGSNKIGTLRTERRRNGDGYRLRSEMELHISLAGLASHRTQTEVDAFLDAGFRLQRFTATTRGGALELALEGQWNGRAMVVTGLPGEAQARAFELPEAPFILPSLRPVLMRKRLERGDRVTFQYYDPIGQQPIETDVTFLGRERVELMGTTVEAFHFRQTALGQQSEVWVNALGEVLVEELPLGMRAIREPEAEAKYGLREGVVAGAPAGSGSQLTVAATLDEPVLGRGRWSAARFVLESAPPIEVRAPAELPTRVIIDALELDRLVAERGPTLVLTTEDPALQQSLREILGAVVPERGTRLRVDEKIRALAGWVGREIALAPGEPSEVETASSVLAARRGSAQGRAALLATLLRAEGIPARLTWGVVARGGDGRTLSEHTWVEAFITDWVGVDPTLGMVPVDAGYLVLGHGERIDGGLTRSAVSALQILRIEPTVERP